MGSGKTTPGESDSASFFWAEGADVGGGLDHFDAQGTRMGPCIFFSFPTGPYRGLGSSKSPSEGRYPETMAPNWHKKA